MLIEIYTDGSISNNGKPNAVGGWAAVLRCYEDDVLLGEKELSGAEVGTTSNAMELEAIYRGLIALDTSFRGAKVVVYSDSEYAVLALTKYIHDWKQFGWTTAQNKPVANKALIERIDELRSAWGADVVWVKGHAGIELNERADKLAKAAKAAKMTEIQQNSRYLSKADIFKLIDIHLRSKGFITEGTEFQVSESGEFLGVLLNGYPAFTGTSIE